MSDFNLRNRKKGDKFSSLGEIGESIVSYLMLTIGLGIGALGWTAFLIPAKIVGGGLTGIATITQNQKSKI